MITQANKNELNHETRYASYQLHGILFCLGQTSLSDFSDKYRKKNNIKSTHIISQQYHTMDFQYTFLVPQNIANLEPETTTAVWAGHISRQCDNRWGKCQEMQILKRKQASEDKLRNSRSCAGKSSRLNPDGNDCKLQRKVVNNSR